MTRYIVEAGTFHYHGWLIETLPVKGGFRIRYSRRGECYQLKTIFPHWRDGLEIAKLRINEKG